MAWADPGAHTDAILAKLQAAGLTVGDARAPAAGGPPYVVLYPLGVRQVDGSVARPWDDAEMAWQTTCVGRTRAEAEWLARKVGEALDGAIAVQGRATLWLQPDVGGGVQREDTSGAPPLFIATPRWRLATTPA